MKLYELSQNHNNLYDLMEDESIPIEVIEEALTSIEDEIENKFDNIAKLIKNSEAMAEALDKEEKRLKAKKVSINNKIKWLKGYMLDNLNVMERSSIETGIFKVRKQKNPPSVVITSPDKVDEKYRIPQEDKIDSKEILKDLKSGKKVEGADLAPESYHIRIG